MRKLQTFVAVISIAAVASGGYLYAQPSGEAGGDASVDATVEGEKAANLTPREMTENSDRMIGEMEGMHQRVLDLQKAAREAKDVIKLNCVNESLLVVKKLINLAEEARVELTEAISAGNTEEQAHQYSKVTISLDRVSTTRDEAQGCIGEEIIFVGPTEVSVDRPPIPDDPTDDPDVKGEDQFTVDLEAPAYASPFAPL